MRSSRRGISLTTRRAIEGYLFILPWLVGFALFAAAPLLHSLLLSFHKLESLLGFQTSWVGFANYVKAWVVDVDFPVILWRTLRNSVIDIPIVIAFALFTAILVSQKIRGQQIFRAIFFLPVVIGSSIVISELQNQGITEQMSIIRSVQGVGEFLVTYLGSGMTNTLVELLVRLSMVVWGTGVQVLLFLAGLQGISTSLYEAARVDGATEWEMFWKITLPMLSPIILVVIVYTVVASFTSSTMTNQGGLLYYIHLKAFSGTFEMGFSSAMAWTYFAIIFVIMALVFLFMHRYTYYAGER